MFDRLYQVELILSELARLKITPASKITYIRAGMNDEFAHLLSFRRQMYIEDLQMSLLPPTLSINIDNAKHFIYLSSQKVTCFLCNEEGHLAKHCQTHANTLETINSESSQTSATAELIEDTCVNDT